MPITFDTLEELQEFYKSFKLDENARASLKKAKGKVGRPKTVKTSTSGQSESKPGRKPAKKAVKPAAQKTAKPAAKKAAKPAAKKAAKPAASKVTKKIAPKKPVKAAKPAAKKATKPAVKKATPKAAIKKAIPRPAAAKNGGATLTGKIQGTIRKFLDDKKSFTANDIYADLSQRDKTVNKQSVITSVLKQMNSTFKSIPVTERPGNGPRPVKLYNP